VRLSPLALVPPMRAGATLMPFACLAVNANYGRSSFSPRAEGERGMAPALAFGSWLNIAYLLATFVLFSSAMRLTICA
jgi:hypothetical protein